MSPVAAPVPPRTLPRLVASNASPSRRSGGRAVAARAALPKPDRGSDGAAQLLRPRGTEQVATGERGIGRERTDVLRYADAHLADRMWHRGQLNDRQHAVAIILLRLFEKAGIEPQVTGSYAPPGWNHSTGDDEAEEPAAQTAYRRLLKSRSPGAAHILEALCLGQHPGTRYLATLQASLDDLAELWGTKGEPPPLRGRVRDYTQP